jgi:hypothetical protein
MWRLSIADLHSCGFPRGDRHNPQYWEEDLDPLKSHINLYEFVAIIIQIWIAVRQLHSDTATPPGGHRLASIADNTSALSWLLYSGRTTRPPIRRLARFLLAFLAHPFPAANLRIQGKHLPGKHNTGADLLSRFEKAPSWESAIQQFSPLKTLRTCLIPQELLLNLSLLVRDEQTEEWFEQKMIELWTIGPPLFAAGSAQLQGSTTSLWIS